MSNILLNAYFSGGTSTGGPLDINGTTNAGTAFDTAKLNGFGEAAAIVTIGNIAADSTVLKVQHSDDNSTWADVTGAAFSGAALPTAAGGDNRQWLLHFRMGGTLKRYLRVSATAGAGATLYGVVWIGLHGGTGVNGSTETARSIAQNLGDGTNLGRVVISV